MMNQRVFETFFGTERVDAGSKHTKPTPKRDSTRSLSKGNWSYYAVVCKKCGRNFGPANNIRDEEMREWPGLQQHIDDYHEAEAVMVILRGLGQ